MSIESVIGWAMTGLFVLVGLGLMLARVDSENLCTKIHTYPFLALYRFPWFRYGAAVLCFIMAFVVYSTTL